MVVNREDLMNELSNVYSGMDDGLSDDDVKRRIASFQESLDTHVTETSLTFNKNKDRFLSEHTSSFKVMDLDGFIPVEEKTDRLPVTPEGIVAYSVYDMDGITDDVWSRMASLDSPERFDALREETKYVTNNASPSMKDIESHLLSSSDPKDKDLYASFDDVSVDKLVKIAKGYEADIQDLAVDYSEGYPDFIMENPEYQRDDNPYLSYIASLQTGDYKESFEKAKDRDYLDFEDAKSDDFRRSPVAKRKSYDQLLYGLYDNDANAVESSGLKDDFSHAMDSYFIETNKSLNDLYINSQNKDPQVDGNEFWQMVQGVSTRLGFTELESREAIDRLDHEERMYLTDGEIYASRRPEGTDAQYVEPGNREDRFKWLLDSYDDIYGQPVDFNADQQRYHQDSIQNEEMSDDVLNDMEKQFRQEQAGRVAPHSNQNDGLFGVSLGESIDPESLSQTVALSQPDASERLEVYLKSITETDESLKASGYTIPEDRPAFMQAFSESINDSVKSWDMSVDDLTKDPDAFKDLVAYSSMWSMNELQGDDSSMEPHTIDEAYTAMNRVFDQGFSQMSIQSFADGYKDVLNVPMDASLKTINEVKRDLDQPEDETIDGELSYYDVSKVSSAKDLERLRRELKGTVETEIEQEVERDMVDYNDYKEALNNSDDLDDDDWDLEL